MPIRAQGHVIPIGPPAPLLGGEELNFEPQDETNWCWAACVEMVLKHHHISTEEQCKIAKKGLLLAAQIAADQNCCPAPHTTGIPARCNKTLLDGEITRLWQLPEYSQLSVVHQDGKLKKQVLQDMLSHKCQVQLGYDQTNTGHVIIAFGWTEVEGELCFLTHDPLNNPRAVVNASVIARNHSGFWNATWIISKSAS